MKTTTTKKAKQEHIVPRTTGMTGTWGPYGGTWTIVFFIRMDRLVNDYGGAFLGDGSPFTVLESENVTIIVPCGKDHPVPTPSCFLSLVSFSPKEKRRELLASALLANGGALDAVEKGAPWDVPFHSIIIFFIINDNVTMLLCAPFLNHFRQLCVVNDSTSLSYYVDGELYQTVVVNSATTTTVIPANSPVTIAPLMPGVLAECLVWNGVTLTLTKIQSLLRAQRHKWGIDCNLLTAATTTSYLVSSAPSAVLASSPQNVPTAMSAVTLRDLRDVSNMLLMSSIPYPGLSRVN